MLHKFRFLSEAISTNTGSLETEVFCPSPKKATSIQTTENLVTTPATVAPELPFVVP